jgi:hypothetical protein
MTDHDVAVATPPTNNNNDGGRLDQSIAEELVARARSEGVDLVRPGGLLGDLAKQILETGLEVEMDEHLGYTKHDSAGRNHGNSRNGTRSKTVITEIGPVDIDVPRDRDGTFEPVVGRDHDRVHHRHVHEEGRRVTSRRLNRTQRGPRFAVVAVDLVATSPRQAERKARFSVEE